LLVIASSHVDAAEFASIADDDEAAPTRLNR